MGKVNNINVSSIELTNKKPNPSKGYEVRECEHQVDGEPWLMESDYYSGTTYADRRWEEKKVTDRGWHYLRICHKYVNGKVEVINSSIPEYRDLIKILGGKDDEIETGLFPYAIEALLDNGEKVDANKLKKVATQFGLTNPNEIIQQAELGVVKSARKIANNGESLRVRFEKIRDIYDLQPTISPKDGRANFLQQYSTPAPIAFLAGEFVKSENKHAHYLEPSAGNGMLTIALPVENTWVNDLDDVRYKNLLTQGFSQVTNLDASTINNGSTSNTFNGVITNPPFGRLSKKDFLVRKGRKGNKEIEYTFEVLDHKLAILALENMADNGRCAIIVGGKLASKMYDHKKAFWKDDRLFGDFNVFVSYLNRQYNLIDILYISGDLYAKQGTTYPIVMLLIDGRKEWDAEPTAIWHKYDEKLDKPIESLSEYWDRMVGHIEKQETKQAPVQSSLVTFSNERVVKNYPEDYTAKDILFKGEKIGFAIMNESKTYYIDGDKLDHILNGRYTQKGSFLNIWCHSIYDKTKEHFTKESFFCDGLRFVFSQEDDVIKFMSLFDELFIKNAKSASSDLERKRKLLILAKAKIKIAQAKAKNGLIGLFGAEMDEYKQLNDIFNAKLEELKNGLLPSSYIFQLGMPAKILKKCGFPNDPIEMSAKQLLKKSQLERHPFDILDLKSLVYSLQNPIAVFAYGDKQKAQNVITELENEAGKKFLIGVHFKQEPQSIVVSNIRGIFPKDNIEWLNWVTQKGKLIYVKKKKVLNLVKDIQGMNFSEPAYAGLNLIAKEIKKFENPK